MSKQFGKGITESFGGLTPQWRLHVGAAAGTSDILIHAVTPAAVRYNDCTRNQKHNAALGLQIGFQYQKPRRIDREHGLLNCTSVTPVSNQGKPFLSLGRFGPG